MCDSGSTDVTVEIATDHGALVLKDCGEYRADRINAGIKKATGDIILIHHPRSFLESGAFEALIQKAKEDLTMKWGAFTHCFDRNHPLLKFTSFYSNMIRSTTQSIYYLDHCIFFIPERIGGKVYLPSVPIFEDTELSKILKKHGRPVRLKQKSVTSSVRFNKNGIYRQSVLNQAMKAMYLTGFSKNSMDRIYEAGLKLNSK